MKHFFFTFGSGHPFRNKVMLVRAKDSEQARTAMVRLFSANWAFEYAYHDAEKGFFKQASAYNLEALAAVFVTQPPYSGMLDIQLVTEGEFRRSAQEAGV